MRRATVEPPDGKQSLVACVDALLAGLEIVVTSQPMFVAEYAQPVSALLVGLPVLAGGRARRLRRRRGRHDDGVGPQDRQRR